jgi:hypothetical protein
MISPKKETTTTIEKQAMMSDSILENKTATQRGFNAIRQTGFLTMLANNPQVVA